jgi:hypothetical protein
MTLGRDAARNDGIRERFANDLAGLEIPVLDEHRLQLEHDGSRDANHQFFVSEPRLEGRVHQVERARESDAPVDDGDLAVIAQIHARATLAHEGDPHRLSRFDAGVAQSLREGAIAEAARAQRVRQHAARHAALGRPVERGQHASGDRIVGDNVEQQVDVNLRLVDVGGETVEDRVVVAQHLDRIAAENGEIAELFGKMNARRNRGVLRRMANVGMREQPFAHGGAPARRIRWRALSATRAGGGDRRRNTARTLK